MQNFTTMTRLFMAGAFLVPVMAVPAQDTQPASAPAATVYTIEAEDSELSWVGRKVTGQHDGGFRSFSGTVAMAGDDLSTLALDVTIDTTSLWADNERLANHLKSGDFFEVETYPTAHFVSTDVQVQSEDSALVTGDLTLHGQTNPISFPATVGLYLDEEGQPPHVHLESEFTLLRFTWGIDYIGREGDEIVNEVAVAFHVKAVIESHDEDGDHDHETHAEEAHAEESHAEETHAPETRAREARVQDRSQHDVDEMDEDKAQEHEDRDRDDDTR